MIEVFDDEIVSAIKRIALTEDGRKLHLGLQRALIALAPTHDTGALQVFEGGRRFAASLKELMDQSISEHPGVGTAESTVVISRRAVNAPVRQRGAGRRVSYDPAELAAHAAADA